MATEINPKRYDLSASSIASFKSCPVRFKLAYREGLRLDEDTESQRMGSNWHSMHEVYHAEVAHARTVVSEIRAEHPEYETGSDDGTEAGHAHGLQAVVNHLNERYAKMPAGFDIQKWALERQILLTCFIGYLWYWQNDPIEVLTSEVAFELPVHEPKTGMPLPLTEVRRVGKIDHVIKWQEMVGTIERKSTSRAIDPDSDYWDKARKDTQVSMYALAFREMRMPPEVEAQLLFPDGRVRLGFGGTLYDVWHKPTIKPAMLSQKETDEFIRNNTYYDQKFHVIANVRSDDFSRAMEIIVNDVTTPFEQGKKGFAIRETIEMFAARLLADIQERPGFYFQRREIARTDADLKEFREELFAVYQTQRLMEKHNTWFSNESQCRATFPCPFIPVCYGKGHKEISATGETPAGFKRIFVDLTVNGQEREE